MCSETDDFPQSPGIVSHHADREFCTCTNQGGERSALAALPEETSAQKERTDCDVIDYCMSLRRNNPRYRLCQYLRQAVNDRPRFLLQAHRSVAECDRLPLGKHSGQPVSRQKTYE